MAFKWIKPDVYPLIGFVAIVVFGATFQFTRMLSSHPGVRVNKDDRQTAILLNYKEGQKYYDHPIRRYVSTQRTEMMPGMNDYFVKLFKKSDDQA